MTSENNFVCDDNDLFAIFLEEAREQIEVLDQGLVSLEHEPGNIELIQSIFRAAHTLKGSSGAMGLRQIAHLTHAMEDVLHCVREGTLEVTSEIADALLEGLDLLRAMEKDLEEGRSEVLTSEDEPAIALTLHAIATSASVEKIEQAPVIMLPTAISSACEDNGQVAVLVQFCPECQMPGIRALMVLRELEGLGTILSLEPTREALDRGEIGDRMLIADLRTQADEALIRQRIDKVAEIAWARVARGATAESVKLDAPSRNEAADDRRSAVDRRSADDRRVSGQNGVQHQHGQPQQTIRVGIDVLDRIMNLVGELVLDRTRVAQLKNELPEAHRNEEFVRSLDAVSQHLGSIVEELHEQIMKARMLPVSQLFNRFPRMVRDISHQLHKEVNFVVEGENELLDRSVIEKLVDPLTHMLRNAVDHGLETPEERERMEKPRCGTVMLTARRIEEHVLIEVTDDGPGINVQRLKEKALAMSVINQERMQSMNDQEACGLIFASGLSTAKAVSDVSGRGVGMDVVKRNIDELNGSIIVDSTPNLGTRVTIKIPLTLAIVRALIVRVGQVSMAIPLSHIEESLEQDSERLQSVKGVAMMQWRNSVVPVVHMTDALPGCGFGRQQAQARLIIVRYDNRVAALAVDDIVGHQEIVVKPLGSYLGEIPGLAGATILGNGRVALILDIGKLFDSGYLQQAMNRRPTFGADLAPAGLTPLSEQVLAAQCA